MQVYLQSETYMKLFPIIDFTCIHTEELDHFIQEVNGLCFSVTLLIQLVYLGSLC